MKELVEELFRAVPSGVGSHRKDLRLETGQIKEVMEQGASWAIAHGFGSPSDLDTIEAAGRIGGVAVGEVSQRAMERGRNQLGTLGSGNHFVEIGYVDEIFDEAAARGLRLEPDSVTVIIHTGSRGLGYQVCDDFIDTMLHAASKYQIDLPDRQLCCAPISSEEGQRYLGAMSAAANFAFANRQVITAFVRRTFEEVLGMSPRETGLSVVYDVCHNIAKMEEHEVNGKKRRLCVHRKGATRAFPPGHAETPSAYRSVGQPVLIPGDMGRYSYVLVGTEKAYQETFGSTCHGAGRVLSRLAARRLGKNRSLVRELADRGIHVRSEGRMTLLEEMPEAYKDVARVVDICHRAGISRKVARLKPTGVIKG
jgi:tRNA-splicing ligase RtcB (3'-phosphate/5'-hydroxy nucleic acid ligase)